MFKPWLWYGIALIALVFGVNSVTADEMSSGGIGGGADWNGTWQSQLSTTLLEQEGDTVHGTYVPLVTETSDPGVIDGVVSEDGKRLTGTWSESGPMTMTLSDDGNSFTGTYSHGNQEDEAEWNASRIDSEGQPGETGWNGTWQSACYLLNFTRKGDMVTASYEPRDLDLSDPGVITGTISDDGKAVAGTWNESGRFEYTLSDNGSFFNGTFGYGDSIELSPDYTWNATRVG